MAIALLNEEKYNRAKLVAGEDNEKLVEEYKRIGGAFTEGTNSEIDTTRKVIGIFDPEPAEKPKPAKKSKKK